MALGKDVAKLRHLRLEASLRNQLNKGALVAVAARSVGWAGGRSTMAIPDHVVNLFDVPVAPLTMSEVMEVVAAAIDRRDPLLIGVVNAAKVVNMGRDPALRQSVLDADIVLADGISIVWASRLLGMPLPERVTGIDLMMEMLRQGDRAGWRLYCLGATPDVLSRTIDTIAQDFPGVRIAGSHHGYFEAEDETELARSISDAKADILLVAMTSPKKEQFLARWRETLGVPVCHGVGGSFDVLAGKVQRAPEAWQRLGLEWLYRVKQEPGRLWRRYLLTNLMFLRLLAREMVHRRRRKALRNLI